MEINKEKIIEKLLKWGVSEKDAKSFWEDLESGDDSEEESAKDEAKEDSKGEEDDSDSNTNENTDDTSNSTSEDDQETDGEDSAKNDEIGKDDADMANGEEDETQKQTLENDETADVEEKNPIPAPESVTKDQYDIVVGQVAELKTQMAEIMQTLKTMATSTPITEDINGNTIGSKTQGALPNTQQVNDVTEKLINNLGGRA